MRFFILKNKPTMAILVLLITADWVGADSPTDRQTHLAQARTLLVKSAASPLSRFLNNKSTAEDKAALETIANQARHSLEKYTQTKHDTAASGSERNEVLLLSSLMQVFDAIATLEDNDSSKQKLTTAAIELEIFVDDPNKHIGEAARLWQALAYRLAGKPERSLKILHPILKPGTRSHIDLSCRFERCRALSAAGQHIAAIALSIRTTQIAAAWPKHSGPAFREPVLAAKRLTADLYRAWADTSLQDGNQATAVAARQRADKIDEEVTDDSFFPGFMLNETVVGLESDSDEPNQKNG